MRSGVQRASHRVAELGGVGVIVLQDDAAIAKLENAVDAATQRVSSLTDACQALAAQIAAAEQEITTETEREERKAAARDITATTDEIQERLDALLREIRNFGETTLREVIALTPDEREVRIPSGHSSVIRYRVGWAMTYLTKGALIEKVDTSRLKPPAPAPALRNFASGLRSSSLKRSSSM